MTITTDPPSGAASFSVLIAGGGPVGLAAAIELGRRDTRCLVVEPRATVSHARPRCKTVNVRTMEHLRRWGIAERLREAAPLKPSWSSDVVFCTSLSGRELSRFHGVLGLVPDGDRFAEVGQQAPQFVLEELLREVIAEMDDVTLWTGARVETVDQDADAVTATVRSSGDAASVTIEVEYLIGADGPRSSVRDAIGSAYVGEYALSPNFGMVFAAPALGSAVRHGPAVQYWIINRSAPALMGPLDLDGNWWIIAFGVDRETGERSAREIIDAVAGVPVNATVLSTDPWTARMQLVDRARHGRVFLAGDAAHLNPPFGGHGLNTGIGDAIDLGWKLAAVLQGWGGSILLDSYELERRPVQTQVIAAAEANMRVLATQLVADGIDADGATGDAARAQAHANIQASKHAEFHALDLVLDITHDASPVIVTRDDDAGAEPSAAEVGALRVGARLPHAWLEPGHSLYDALGEGFTLLAPAEHPAVEPLLAAARRRAMPLSLLTLAPEDPRVPWRDALILVRPDQHVAWIGDAADFDAGDLLDRVRGAGAMATTDASAVTTNAVPH